MQEAHVSCMRRNLSILNLAGRAETSRDGWAACRRMRPLAGQGVKAPSFLYVGETWRLDREWPKNPMNPGRIKTPRCAETWRLGSVDGGRAAPRRAWVPGAWRTFRRSLRIKVKGICAGPCIGGDRAFLLRGVSGPLSSPPLPLSGSGAGYGRSLRPLPWPGHRVMFRGVTGWRGESRRRVFRETWRLEIACDAAENRGIESQGAKFLCIGRNLASWRLDRRTQ
jgi:hypothetical protein